MKAQDYGYSASAKLALTGGEAYRLFTAGHRQISDYISSSNTSAAVPMTEWRRDTLEKLKDSTAQCWVVFE